MGFDFKRFKELYARFAEPSDLMQKTFDKAKENIGLLVGDMAFRDTYYFTLVSRLQEDEKAAANFIPFATDGTNGIYAFWFYDARALEEAPIVYFGPDNRRNGVLASSLAEMLAMLGIGKTNIGDVPHWDDQAAGGVEDLDEYLAWLRDMAKVQPITDPKAARAVVEKARQAHPDLDPWIAKWFVEHPRA
jgi:hypothetical protein